MEIKQVEAEIEAILFTIGETVELSRIAAAIEHMRILQENNI